MNPIVPPGDHEALFQRYMRALLEGDIRVIGSIIDALLKAQMPMNGIYRDFIQRGLYEVGLLWERNQISVSIEHLAASATQVVLSGLYPKGQEPSNPVREVIIACVPNELHDVGTIIVANLCEAAGWKTLLLGANLPTRDMLAYIGKRSRLPDLLALSITLPANRAALARDLATITAHFPELNIVLGGQGLDGHNEAVQFRQELLARHPTVHYAQTLDDLERYLNALASGA